MVVVVVLDFVVVVVVVVELVHCLTGYPSHLAAVLVDVVVEFVESISITFPTLPWSKMMGILLPSKKVKQTLQNKL